MSTTRRLNVEVVGSASNFLAMMNRVTSGVTRFGSGLGTMNRNAQQSNRWLQAMSTTLRYAFAGRVIFGIQNAVNNLAEFKTQLGQIDALAGKFQNGKLVGLGGQLDEAGKSALLMSNRFGIAVGDVESYMQRFFSSFNPSGGPAARVAEMNKYTEAVLNLATAIGTEAGDPQKLAGGLTGLINALPGGRANPGKGATTIGNYFAALLRQTPSLTGADIATAAGRFASVKGLTGMTVPQIFSTFGVAAQTGGSPAVIIRGITQLLGQSLMHPTRPQSIRTYQAAGLPTDPNALLSMGGEKVLERLIQFVQAGAVPGDKTGRKNPNLDAIYNAFSRQESVRQFVNLLANGGVPALKNFNKSLLKADKEGIAQQMANTRLRQSLLLRMQNASRNTGIALLQGADWPLENLIARPFLAASNAAIRHPNITKAVVGGAFGLGAANALRRLGMFGKFGRLGKFLGTASGVEQAAVGGAIAKEELPAAIAGGATAGTRANPFWVIISPLSWQMGGPMSTGGGGGGGKFPPIAPLIRGSKFVKGGLLVGGTLITDAILRKEFGWYKGAEDSLTWGDIGHFFNRGNHATVKNLAQLTKGKSILPMPNGGILASLPGVQPHNVRVIFEGNPKADLTVKLVDSQGHPLSIQEHKGVPIVPKAKQFPSSQGKAGSRKGT